MEAKPRRRALRSDAGTVRATERDALALTWVVEMYGMPADLLQRLTRTSDAALRQLFWRWRRGGWVETGHLGAGPLWVWPTARGIAQFGRHSYVVNQPSAGRLAHLRATIETRMWLEGSFPAAAQVSWRSERELRWDAGIAFGAAGARLHIPDGVIEFGPGTDRHINAVEVELTPKTVKRTRDIMRDLLVGGSKRPEDYSEVLYVVTREARPVVERAIGGDVPGPVQPPMTNPTKDYGLATNLRGQITIRSLENDVHEWIKQAGQDERRSA